MLRNLTLPTTLALLVLLLASGAVAQPSAAGSSDHYSLSSFTSAGQGRLDQAIASIGSQSAVLFLDTADVLGADVTVPANITLVHLGGGTIDLGGRTLQVNGAFVASPARVFTDSGAAVRAAPAALVPTGTRVLVRAPIRIDGEVRFATGSVSRIVPQWWGDNTTESVQKALDAAAGCGAELFLPAGAYVFDASVQFLFTENGFAARALTVRGAGPGRTVIDNQSAGEPAFFFSTEDVASQFGWFLTIEGLELTSSTGTGSVGIEINDVWLGRIADCRVADHAQDGILLLANQNDFGLPKTWTIERSLIVQNGGYGIRLDSVSNELSYNVILDQLDVELNAAGGIYAAAELTKLTNSIIAYNGSGSSSNGGIHITGITGFTPYGNLIEGNGFEGNRPYSVYADRAANLTIARNEFSRVLQFGAPQPDDQFIRLDGPQGVENAIIEHNQFGSGVLGPFTAIVGGPGLRNANLDNNVFNLNFGAGDERFTFDPATQTTDREFGDTVLTNQSISFANPSTGDADVAVERSGPGMLSVSGGVVDGFQVVQATGGTLSIDCSLGLTVLHTLPSNVLVLPPVNAIAGAVLRLSVFQGFDNYTVDFDPVFKQTRPFTVDQVSFSTIQFLYTGLYWVQLGEAALSAPL